VNSLNGRRRGCGARQGSRRLNPSTLTLPIEGKFSPITKEIHVNGPRARLTLLLISLAVLLLSTPARATFSIVARDPETGDLGVAVQSHYFSVGPIVPWAEPGVGAVATQSLVEVAYGPRGLALMRSGTSAKEALRKLLEEDKYRDVRQVAMVDAHGEVAAHTGSKCIPDAGNEVGDQFSVQANLMANATIWPSMAKAYRAAKGDFPERLLQALEAGQRAGGDIRGQQSAAIVIVKGTRSDKPWADRVLELRVEDHPKPIAELRRLVSLWRAYRKSDEGDALITEGKVEEALRAYSEAARLAPGNDELLFWQAATLWKLGREKEAAPLFRKVFARDRRWVALAPRLVPADLLPNDPESIRRIEALAPHARGAAR
jgi:uncharacterized Ntn-hydrolase superfamily protein